MSNFATHPTIRLVDPSGIAPECEVPAQQVLAVGKEHAVALFTCLTRAITACEQTAIAIETYGLPKTVEGKEAHTYMKNEVLAYRATAFALTGLNNDVLNFLKVNGWLPNG